MSLRRWTASWRVAGRVARRDAVRDRGRTALVAAMVGLPVLIGAAGGTALASNVTSPARELSWTLAPHAAARIGPYAEPGLQQDADGRGYALRQPPGSSAPPTVTGHETALAALLPAGDRLVRGVTGSGRVTTVAGTARSSGSVRIEELPTTDLAELVVPRLAVGTLPRADDDVVLSASAAARLGATTGDTVTLRADGAAQDVTVHVSAVLVRWPRGADVIAPIGALLPAPADAGLQAVNGTTPPEVEWYVLGTAPVTWDTVLEVNALGSVVTSRAVVLDPPRLAAPVGAGSSSAQRAMVAGVAAIALIEAVLVIGPAFAVSARRSRRQLALLASAGADPATLRRVVLAGGLWIGLSASVAGVVLGVAAIVGLRWVLHLRGSFAMPDLHVPWWLAPGLVGIATVVAVAAAALPSRAVGRLDVVEALAGRRAEARMRRRTPISGLVLVAAGVLAAAIGSTAAVPLLVVGGIVALELGVVLAAGAIVALLGRLAPYLPLAGRFAVRDSVRQRSRTAPALAAVLAALAGVAAGLVYVQSADAQRIAAHESLGAPGTVAIASGTQLGGPPLDDATVAAAVSMLRADLPVDRVAPVAIAVPLDAPGPEPATTSSRPPAIRGLVDVVRAPSQLCPGQQAGDGSPVRTTAVDTRCTAGLTGPFWYDPAYWGRATVVDDGTVMRLLRLPGSEKAADALADGRAVVRSVHDLQPDGTVQVQVARLNQGSSEPQVTATAVLPAVVVDLHNASQFGLVLPPSAVGKLGLTTRTVGLVASTTAMPTQAQQSAAAADRPDDLTLSVEPEPARLSLLVLVLVGAALVVGLGSTALALALFGAETVPDLATLAALGAAPRLRRRIAAAQAGVVVVTGTVLGVGTGLLLGVVLVRMRRFAGPVADPTWVTVVPWSALGAVTLGMPVLAVGAAWLCTRSRLPMVRRVLG